MSGRGPHTLLLCPDRVEHAVDVTHEAVDHRDASVRIRLDRPGNWYPECTDAMLLSRKVIDALPRGMEVQMEYTCWP